MNLAVDEWEAAPDDASMLPQRLAIDIVCVNWC